MVAHVTNNLLVMLDQLDLLMCNAIHEAIPDREEAKRIATTAGYRLKQAGMLLGLMTGDAQPLQATLDSLVKAILKADQTARRAMDLDIEAVTHGMDSEAYERLMRMCEQAEAGYSQWRTLSTLALMHLAIVLTNMGQASDLARAYEGPPTP